MFNIIVVKGLEEKLLHSIRNLQHIDRGTPINMQNISEPTVYDEKAMRNIQFEDSEEAGLTMKTIPPENITIYYCIVPPEKLGLNKFQNIFVTEKIYSKQELKSKDKRMMIAAKTFKGGPFSISSLIRILTMDKMWDEIKLIEGVEINYKWLSKDRLKELEQGSQFTIDEIKKLFKEVNGLEEYYNELTQVYEGELKQIIKAEYEELREDYFNNIKRVSDQVLERVAKDFLKNGETKTIIKPILMDHKSKELIAPDSL